MSYNGGFTHCLQLFSEHFGQFLQQLAKWCENVIYNNGYLVLVHVQKIYFSVFLITVVV